MKGTIFLWWSEIPYLPLFGLHASVTPPMIYRTAVAYKSSAQCIFGTLPENISPNNSSVYTVAWITKRKSCVTEIKVQGDLKCTQLRYEAEWLSL